MKTIWKYPLEITDKQLVAMPIDSEILHVGSQSGLLTLWALVDPSNKPRTKLIHIYGTGMKFEAWALVHLGTVFVGPFVWHVFENPAHLMEASAS